MELTGSSYSRERTAWLIVSILAGIGAFYLSTIRQSEGWADSAMYLHHAKNILNGVPYAQTGYIFNPDYSGLGPPAYPPVFPVLLSLVYALFPGNVTAFHVEATLIFLLALWIIFLNFREKLPRKYMIAAILCIGLNPQYWENKDQVLSDIPFLFFTFLCLFFINRSYSMPTTRWWEGPVAGVLLYLAYGTRSIGVTLAASLLVFELLRYRKISRFAAMAVLVFALLASLQAIYLTGSAYKERFSYISASGIVNGIFVYAKYGAYFWDNGYSKIALNIVAAILFSLSAVGLFSRTRDQLTIYEIFAVLFSAVLILYPGRHHRYLFPLIPLCIWYALSGLEKLTGGRKTASGNLALATLLFLILGSYAAKYTTVQYSLPEGVYKRESTELFQYVKQNTSENDVMIFRRPRALAFYTGRRASVYHRAEQSQELWDYFRRIHATHIIESYFDEEYFRDFLNRHQNSLEKVYSNADFTVYRIRPFPKL